MKMIAMLPAVFAFLSLLPQSSGLLIKSHWSHVRMSTVPPERIDGRRGGEVILLCSASGSPAPSVAWYKDGLFVSHQDWKVEEGGNSLGETVARLVLPCLTDDDAGLYECRARAGEHETTSTTEVHVVAAEVERGRCLVPGRPVIGSWRPMYLVEMGDTARLPCRIQSGVSAVEVSWTNSAGAADNNDVRLVVQQNGDLVINDIQFQDMGQYTCTATGPGGSDSVHTFVYPLAPDRNSLN